MDKKSLILALVASTLIAVLAIPTINNLPLPEILSSLGVVGVAITLGVLVFCGYLFAEFLSKWVSLFKQLGRFAITGVLNTIVDFAVFNFLVGTFAIAGGLMADLFKGISFVFAVVNSYYWNKYWTFQVTKKTRVEFLEFLAVSLLGFGLNVGAFHIIVNVVGPVGDVTPQTWANLGALVGTVAGLIWNFLGYKLIVFRKDS